MIVHRNVRFYFYPELAINALKQNCEDLLLVFLALKAIARKHHEGRDLHSREFIVKLIAELLGVSDTRARETLDAGNGRFWRLGKGKCALVSYHKVFATLIDSYTLPSKPLNISFNDLFLHTKSGLRPSTVLRLFTYACAVSKTNKPLSKSTISQWIGVSERTVARLSNDNPFLTVTANMHVLGSFIDQGTAKEFCMSAYRVNKGVFMLNTKLSWTSVVKRIGNSFDIVGFNPKAYQEMAYIPTRHGDSLIWKPVEAAKMATDARLLKVGSIYV